MNQPRPADGPAPASPASPAITVGTLEQLVGAKTRGRGALDQVTRRIQHDSRLSASYLGLGATALAVAVMIRGVVSLAWAGPTLPWGWLAIAGWIIAGTSFAFVVSIAFVNRGVLPVPYFIGAIALATIALALDVTAFVLSDGSGPSYLTVEIGVGALLLSCVSFRPLVDTFQALVGLTVLAIASLIIEGLLEPENLAVGTSNLVLTVIPTLAALGVAYVFDQHVRRQLDRTVAESAIGTRGTAQGILAVSTLTRLDARAEALFDAVATDLIDETGTNGHPRISTADASYAALLGDELRAVLVADHEMTWLQLAVADSAYLSPVVTITDPLGLATRLEAHHRTALLSVVWVIASTAGAHRLGIDVEFVPSPRTPSTVTAESIAGGSGDRSMIVVHIAGIRVRAIDPSVWPLLDDLGPRVVTSSASRILRITVANPAIRIQP